MPSNEDDIALYGECTKQETVEQTRLSTKINNFKRFPFGQKKQIIRQNSCTVRDNTPIIEKHDCV